MNLEDAKAAIVHQVNIRQQNAMPLSVLEDAALVVLDALAEHDARAPFATYDHKRACPKMFTRGRFYDDPSYEECTCGFTDLYKKKESGHDAHTREGRGGGGAAAGR